jgi:hypothetical protein
VSRRAATEGWKQVEAVLVPLASLARAGRPLARRSAALRQHWWRLWRAAQALRSDDPFIAGLPPHHARRLAPLLAAVSPPPAWVRIAGDLRVLGWRTRRALSAAPAKPLS